MRSDVFSLGVTLYWMLTGVKPFTGGSPTEILEAVHMCAPAALRDLAPHVPAKLARIVVKAMAPDPADRHDSMATLDAALGFRTDDARSWDRIAAHPGHAVCFVGSLGRSQLDVCVTPATGGKELEISVRHSRSKRQKASQVLCSARELPARLRATFRQHA